LSEIDARKGWEEKKNKKLFKKERFCKNNRSMLRKKGKNSGRGEGTEDQQAKKTEQHLENCPTGKVSPTPKAQDPPQKTRLGCDFQALKNLEAPTILRIILKER